jgi:VIT1/CCC1 family predicted Fe2+/Mn2+ transporter
MELIITLVVVGLIAWLNHYLAEQRGRNPIGWAIGGVIFGLLATILLLILGETQEHRIEVINKANSK